MSSADCGGGPGNAGTLLKPELALLGALGFPLGPPAPASPPNDATPAAPATAAAAFLFRIRWYSSIALLTLPSEPRAMSWAREEDANGSLPGCLPVRGSAKVRSPSVPIPSRREELLPMSIGCGAAPPHLPGMVVFIMESSMFARSYCGGGCLPRDGADPPSSFLERWSSKPLRRPTDAAGFPLRPYSDLSAVVGFVSSSSNRLPRGPSR
mmetsp:Transcript_56017/g.131090  ORF Transcript_56017/g.131090 Transcript_56017/m.131090 type:complete len:210 (-) Transcript_56017:376-1005(-)